MKALKNREISFIAPGWTHQNEVVDTRRGFDDGDFEFSHLARIQSFSNGAQGWEAGNRVLCFGEDLQMVPLGQESLRHGLETFTIPFFGAVTHRVD